MKYVLGFAFSGNRIALIQKCHPEWQRGKFNAIGGQVEKGELVINAMIREFKEETGVLVNNWLHFASMNVGENEIHCFVHNGPNIADVRSMTSERIWFGKVREILNPVGDLEWLIPIARWAWDTKLGRPLEIMR